MNEELRKSEPVVACCAILLYHLIGETEENYEDISQCSLSLKTEIRTQDFLNPKLLIPGRSLTHNDGYTIFVTDSFIVL
jgi:hypothetical protein